MPSNVDAQEARLTNLMASLRHEPLEFVRLCFPWGEPGELVNESGPDTWQVKVLTEIRDGLRKPNEVIREAVASGNGIGKSAMVSWLILWGLATFPGTRIVVTANTEGQLRTKTWPTLAFWHRLFLANHWFRITATGLYTADETRALDWRADAIPWSETNPEAFQGLHNKGKRLMLLMDEASAIHDIIWEKAEGAMTDEGTQILWCAFGNPTRATGRFRDCFDRYAHRWNHHNIDSRTSKTTNKKEIAAWEADHDQDDDFFRIHVRGEFPRFGSRQFISTEMVRAAASPERQIIPTVYDPLIMGCDISRYGHNETVIRFRRGRDGRSIQPTRLQGQDTMVVVEAIIRLYEEHSPDGIFIDGGGIGAGVMDRCRQLKLPVLEVQFGARASNDQDHGSGRGNYYNKRSEMYAAAKSWLEYGMIDADKKLMDGLSAPEYSLRTVNGVDSILLEKKEDIYRRLGEVSLDDADAFCCTFAYSIQRSDHTAIIAGRTKTGFTSDYSPLAAAWAVAGDKERQTKQNWIPGGPLWGS